VIVACAPAPPEPEVRSLAVAGRMEIEAGNGRRVTVGADVDAAALARVVSVLEGR
jgi:transposase